MGTLYIDRKELHIKLDGNALAFYANGDREGIVPVNPLKRVIVVGSVSFETTVLHRLADENVTVVFLSGKRLRFCGMLHGRLHKNGLLRLKQYEKSLAEFALEMARELVTRKVIKQKSFLEEARALRPDLGLKLTTAANTLGAIIEALGREMITPPNLPLPQGEERLASLRGLEGGAAASYFAAYVTMFAKSLEFERRTRRPPEGPVNALLSLCYTMLHYEMVREIEIIGLDPTIGFYHQFDYGRESLACDLVEPFRPEVDRFVYETFRNRQFTARDFAEDDERPGCYLKKGSRRRFYPLYEEWATGMRPLWVDEVRTLARRIMDGQNPLPE
jgi:CRISPR-associated protein Cas1